MPLSALVSIHDVMPETLAHTQRLLDAFPDLPRDKITILVVPGKPWKAPDLARLRDWFDQGIQPAGHGRVHKVDRIRGFYHRLHSTFISRDVAEHLALDREGIRALIQDSWDFFEQHDFPQPALYVPPAWAMGKMSRKDLDALPYAAYETLTGVYANKTFEKLPLTGYEADTPLRAWFVSRWNRANQRRAERTGAPLRISIHPNDLELKLSDPLRELLAGGAEYRSYGSYRTYENRAGE